MAALSCPRDASPLAGATHEGVEVDECAQCGGTWLDRGELEAIQERREKDYRQQIENESDVAPLHLAELELRQTHGTIACPRCQSSMETREHGLASRVLVDGCPSGCGVWLDAGELEALEKFYERNRDNETLPLGMRLWCSLLGLVRR
jgi:Zn-finger nucleic acid-binding protein